MGENYRVYHPVPRDTRFSADLKLSVWLFSTTSLSWWSHRFCGCYGSTRDRFLFSDFRRTLLPGEAARWSRQSHDTLLHHLDLYHAVDYFVCFHSIYDHARFHCEYVRNWIGRDSSGVSPAFVV